MVYEPIKQDKRQAWIKWLNNQVSLLSGREEEAENNDVFSTPEGDVATGKDLVGNLLATLTGSPVEIK